MLVSLIKTYGRLDRRAGPFRGQKHSGELVAQRKLSYCPDPVCHACHDEVYWTHILGLVEALLPEEATISRRLETHPNFALAADSLLQLSQTMSGSHLSAPNWISKFKL
jgi:hypothetical protein